MALVLGTSSGFVTVAPTTDPNGGAATTIDGSSVVTKDTSPANAVKITEIGWYRGGTNTANWEIALYSDTAGVADARLFVDATNSTASSGWVTTAVDWDITPNTPYWLGLQMDAHTGSSTVDSEASGGAGIDLLATQTALNDPYGGGAVADADGMRAIYALVAPISAAITGTVTASITEADVVTGGKTIIITLTNATWKAAGTGPIGSTADTQAIIDGITSAQAEGTGWNAVVKVGIETADVVRTSATVATITLDAEATYDITATETITVTVPTAALATGVGVVASPTFTVSSVASGNRRRRLLIGTR
jgi:hypothetical protein